MKPSERRKLTGCGNIDRAKGLYEMDQEAVAPAMVFKIMMLKSCLTRVDIMM